MCEEYDNVIWDDADNPCIGGQCRGYVRKAVNWENRGKLVVFWTSACEAHIDHEGHESDPITRNHVILRRA